MDFNSGLPLEHYVDDVTRGLRPGSHVDLTALGLLGPVAEVGEAEVTCLEDGRYQTTLGFRAGPAIGIVNGHAQGTALGTVGGTLTQEFESRDALNAAVANWIRTAPGAAVSPASWVLSQKNATRASLVVEANALALAGHTLVESRGSLSALTSLTVDLRKAEVTHRISYGGSGAMGFMAEVGPPALHLKAETEQGEASVAGSFGVETTYRLDPQLAALAAQGKLDGKALVSRLPLLQLHSGPSIVVRGRVALGGKSVTVSSAVTMGTFLREPLALTRLLDPKNLRYESEHRKGTQLSVNGGVGLIGGRVVLTQSSKP